MKKNLFLLLVFSLVFCMLLSACGETEEEYVPSPLPEREELSDRTDGTVVYSENELFKITTFPTELYLHDGNKNICYSFMVENNTANKYKKFTATLVMNKQLDYYIQSGALSMPTNTFDMAAKGFTEGNDAPGVAFNMNSELSNDDIFAQYGLKIEDVETLAENYSLKMTWKGGETTQAITMPVINKLDNAPASYFASQQNVSQ